ncbi:hypothetical protein WAJ30_22805, partial [Acinetobacter baumannii]
ETAHDLGLPVAAHAQGSGQGQGAGQAERAIAAVDLLAHTPWTPLDDATIALAAERTTWISTLAMHERDGDGAALGAAV